MESVGIRVQRSGFRVQGGSGKKRFAETPNYPNTQTLKHPDTQIPKYPDT
jgi:hypothetical protein